MNAVAGMDGYRAFLARRDGALDQRLHTLAAREALFATLAASPLRSQAAIDADAYRRNLRRRRPERGLDARVLWLLATAKANQAERFGVGLSEVYGRVPSADDDPVRLHLHLQELYHTRLLADVVAIFGLPVHPQPPPFFTRAFIRLLVHAPPEWVLPAVGFGEVAGCVLFRALRDRGVALFADEPAVAERIAQLYDEILADEICHVGYITAQLGPIGLHVMRALSYLLGPWLAQMPELTMLFDRADLARRFASFDVDAMAAEVGDRAYAFGRVGLCYPSPVEAGVSPAPAAKPPSS